MVTDALRLLPGAREIGTSCEAHCPGGKNKLFAKIRAKKELEGTVDNQVETTSTHMHTYTHPNLRKGLK